MKRKKLLIFTLFVALVVGYAIYDYQSSLSQAEKKVQESFLVQYDSEQIQLVQLNNGKETIELKKEPSGWQMMKPRQELADQKAVEEFVDGIATEKYSETVVEGDQVDFSNFGLDQPLGNITVTNNSGESLNFTVGRNKNFQGEAYLRINDQKKVLLASSTWFTKINKTTLDFRDKRLMKFPSQLVEKLSFETGKERFALVKKEDSWILSAHPEWRLDQNKVRDLLAQLNSTNALEYISETKPTAKELQTWGLNSPRLTIKAFLKEGKTWQASFSAGNDKVHRVLTSAPEQVLKISPTDSDKFYQMTADSFRDRYEPFQFDRTENQEVEIKLGKSSYRLKPENPKSGELIKKLRNLTVSEFRETEGKELENEIRVKSEGKDIFQFQWGNLQKVKFNNAETKVFTSRTSKYPKTFTLLESDINSLQLDELTENEKIP